ncbi:MAG TPA: hypothetical protein VFS08_03070 [Gemmatimonadaceae bacterium]|nr:hypothetical protein [Gemmatimonadaceae bacterium]
MGRRRAVVLAIVTALLAAAPAAAQTHTQRFLIDSVGDSTFVFRIGADDDWVRRGSSGIAVDPRRRDALVARFRVLSVGDRQATALVTGQTTFVTTDHVALLEEPPRSFFRQGAFWAGAFLGGVLGALAALSF